MTTIKCWITTGGTINPLIMFKRRAPEDRQRPSFRVLIPPTVTFHFSTRGPSLALLKELIVRIEEILKECGRSSEGLLGQQERLPSNIVLER